MSNIRFGLDVDGVINDFIAGYDKMYKRYFPDKEKPDNVDGHKNWNWFKFLDYDGEDPEKWFYSHKHLSWNYCKPCGGSSDVVQNLYIYLKKLNIPLYIVTMQPTQKSCENCEKWLKKHGFIYDKIIFVHRSFEKWNHIDILVDDSPSVLSKKPEGKISIKVNYENNKDVSSDFSINHITNLNKQIVDSALKKFKLL